MKFKVGDKVRVRTDLVIGKKYGGQGCKEKLTLNPAMACAAGKIYTVKKFTPNGNYDLKESCFVYAADMLEPAHKDHRKVVITQDGVVTKARFYNGNTVIKETSAKCHPDDEFSFEIGASLAFERLGLKPTKSPDTPQYYSGKVVCIASSVLPGGFSKGRIYEIISGRIVDDGGSSYEKYVDVEQLNDDMSAKFIELIE